MWTVNILYWVLPWKPRPSKTSMFDRFFQIRQQIQNSSKIELNHMAVPWKAICSAFRELNKSIFKASFSDWAVLSHFNCAILICTLFSFLPCWKPEVHFKGTSHLSPFPVASQCFEPLAQQLVSKASVLYQRKKNIHPCFECWIQPLHVNTVFKSI